jgi:pyridoxal phosphate-dependent aminotransferase EpsN
MGIFSFNGNKIITTSGGGMLVSSDPGLVQEARFLASQARDAAAHYEHSRLGFNYRMSNVLAGIGRGQLQVLSDRVNRRRRNCDFYKRALEHVPGITFMPEAPYGRSTRWLTVLQVDPEGFGANREQIRLALEARDIETRPVWKPMHLQPLFHSARRVGGGVAERLFDRGLCLPSGSHMTEDDLSRVVEALQACGKQGRRLPKLTEAARRP